MLFELFALDMSGLMWFPILLEWWSFRLNGQLFSCFVLFLLCGSMCNDSRFGFKE